MLKFLPDDIYYIDDDNPLSYKLKHAWLIGPDSLGGTVRDLRGRLNATITGSAAQRIGKFGRELVCDAATKSFNCGAIGSDFEGQSWTALIIGYGDGTGAVNRLAAYGGDGSVGWSIDASVYNASHKIGMAEWGVGDSQSSIVQPSEMAAIAIRRNGTNFAAAANGQVDVTNALGNPVAWTTNKQFRVGSGVRLGGGNTSLNGAVMGAYLWNREFTPEELKEITIDPWQVLTTQEKAQRKLYAIGTAFLQTNNPATGVPVITGTKTEGETLTCDTSGIADADGLGSFSYQWLRNGANISGATNSTYVLTAFDVATTITVRVSFTDLLGNPESVISAGYSPIAAASATSYQRCYFPVVINPAYLDNSLSGDPSFTNFVGKVTEADILAAFMDGGSQSAENGGGNITVHTNSDLSEASRLALKVVDFDINAGTADLRFLIPALLVSTGITVYIAKGDPTDVQPDPATTYGSDAVDTYDPALVPPTDPSDLKTTYDNQDTEADFWTAGAISCTLIGGGSVAPSSGIGTAPFSPIFKGVFADIFSDVI